MAADLPQAEPSEGLLQRIRAAVEEADQLPEPPASVPVQPVCVRVASARASVPPPSRWRRVVPVGLVAAALAAIVGLGCGTSSWPPTATSSRRRSRSRTP